MCGSPEVKSLSFDDHSLPTTAATLELAGAKQAPVAAMPHTFVLIVVLLVMSALGAGTQQEFLSREGRMNIYLFTLAWEWGLMLYVIWGLRRRRVKLAQLIGGRWSSSQDVLRDIGIAVGFWITASAVLGAVGYLLGLTHGAQMGEAKKLNQLLPRGALEVTVWIALSASAGFCEEIIFRGYLQRQFSALAGRLWVGVAAQAALFGAAHGYEGWRRMVLIAIYGALFSALAQWRRSLRPGMIGHALQDSLAALATGVFK